MARRYVNSVDDLAAAVGCSARIVYSWRSRFASEFPAKVDGKGYDVGATKKFIATHGLKIGNSRSHANGDGTAGDDTVSGARRLLLIEQRHLARIEKDRRNLDLQTALGGVVLLEDACQHAEQIIATAKACLLEAVDKVDRELPREMSPEIRERCLAVVARSARAALDTLAGLTGDEDSELQPEGKDDDSRNTATGCTRPGGAS